MPFVRDLRRDACGKLVVEGAETATVWQASGTAYTILAHDPQLDQRPRAGLSSPASTNDFNQEFKLALLLFHHAPLSAQTMMMDA